MKKTLWTIIIVVVAAVSIVLLFKSSKAASEAKAEPIKIGAVLGLTGDAATDSFNIKRGIRPTKKKNSVEYQLPKRYDRSERNCFSDTVFDRDIQAAGDHRTGMVVFGRCRISCSCPSKVGCVCPG